MTTFDITLDGTYDLFIDGEFQKPSNDYFQAVNPANGETLADVGSASSEDVDQAVKAARKAFPEWSKQSIEERSQYLHDIADALEENKERLSKIDCLDTGRPIYEFKSNYGDYNIAIVQFRYFASAILDFTGMSRPLKDGNWLYKKNHLAFVGKSFRGMCLQLFFHIR